MKYQHLTNHLLNFIKSSGMYSEFKRYMYHNADMNDEELEEAIKILREDD